METRHSEEAKQHKPSTFKAEINFQLNGESRKIRKDNSHCWCVFRSAGFVCYHTDHLLSLLAATTRERKSERKPQVWVQQRLGQKYVNWSNFSNWNVKIFSNLKAEFIRRRKHLLTLVAFGEIPYLLTKKKTFNLLRSYWCFKTDSQKKKKKHPWIGFASWCRLVFFLDAGGLYRSLGCTVLTPSCRSSCIYEGHL